MAGKKTPIMIVSEKTEHRVEFPRDIAEYWSESHEDTKPEDAEWFNVYEDEDGAFVCSCCAVNYNPAVDKD